MYKYDILIAAAVSPSHHWSPLRRNNDHCFIIQRPGGDTEYWRMEDRSGQLISKCDTSVFILLMKWKKRLRYRLERMKKKIKAEAGECCSDGVTGGWRLCGGLSSVPGAGVRTLSPLSRTRQSASHPRSVISPFARHFYTAVKNTGEMCINPHTNWQNASTGWMYILTSAQARKKIAPKIRIICVLF